MCPQLLHPVHPAVEREPQDLSRLQVHSDDNRYIIEFEPCRKMTMPVMLVRGFFKIFLIDVGVGGRASDIFRALRDCVVRCIVHP